jgi:hypothetical protein
VFSETVLKRFSKVLRIFFVRGFCGLTLTFKVPRATV